MPVRHGATLLELLLALLVIAIAAGAGLAGQQRLRATRAVRGLLYGVPATDPVTFAVAAGLLGLTVLAASWVPARRASRADPAIALRAE